ncbi:MAG: hypothetical protein IKR19_08990 [Acholeplasmatales bacterium]|nr:hypothetical protein [Acholeplasmatales bacterium]
MTEQRRKAEELIYKVFDAADVTGTNTDYYKKLFASMSDDDFIKFCKRRLPFRFHTKAFEIEPKMNEIIDSFKALNVPLLEKVKLPYVYIDPQTKKPVETQECLVLYIHLKRMKQMLTKKNHSSINTDKRDMRTGLLSGDDKGGKETDREFESLATMGLEYTMDEFARPKADALEAASQMSNAILSKGSVSDSDITVAKTDSLGKKLFSTYLLGAHIYSNLIDTDYMTPFTAKNKKQLIHRTN